MKVLVDENVPFAREAFGTLGEVETRPGRAIRREDLLDVELLVVRSVTPVGAELLEGTPVRFVGTCTIGTDHVDLEYLKKKGIGFASAPGSNAESVAEYVVSALLTLAERHGFELAGKSIGVVGVGNVGSRVARNAEALGMHVLLNDPPLQRLTGDEKYRPLDELLQADFLTLHVPLTRSGPDATFHLFDSQLLSRLQPRCFLLNTARGAVVDNTALLEVLEKGKLAGAVLDVWEGEPAVDHRLLGKVELGTPHIAGYSYDGKVRATEMIYQAACAFLGQEPQWNASTALSDNLGVWRVETNKRDAEEVLREVVRQVYDVREDDERLRRSLTLPEAERPAFFDKLRREYPRRREFTSLTVELAEADERLRELLRRLRFSVR